MQDRLMFALDIPDLDFAKKCLPIVSEHLKWVKIGMEPYYAYGPKVIDMAKENGLKVFLDVKLHDIPQTIEKTAKRISKLSVDFLNVHSLGGPEMVRAAKNGLGDSKTKLIAVTLLNSLDQETVHQYLKMIGPIRGLVADLAKESALNGADGVLCSPEEAEMVKAVTQHDFYTLCPNTPSSDQRQALNDKIDYFIMDNPSLQQGNLAENLKSFTSQLEVSN